MYINFKFPNITVLSNTQSLVLNFLHQLLCDSTANLILTWVQYLLKNQGDATNSCIKIAWATKLTH